MLRSVAGRRGFRVGMCVVAAAAAIASTSPNVSALVWPNTAERVAKQLDSSDPATRARAAQQLARLPQETARRLIPMALSDSDMQVRLAAAQAVLAISVPKASRLVIPWLSDPEQRIRLAATKVLREQSDPAAIDALGRVLADPDVAVRVGAARALAASQKPRAALLLLSHLDDTELEMKLAVVRALAALGDARSVVPLIGKIQDSRPEVREEVARALGRLGDARATSALVLALRDKEENVQMAALEALGRIGDPSALSAIIGIIEERPAEAVQRAAYAALTSIPHPQSLEVLLDVLQVGHPHVDRNAAVHAIGSMGPDVIPRLEKCISGQPPRSLADGCVQALALVGESSSAGAVTAALRSGTVSAAVGLRALAELEAPEAVPVLLEYLTHRAPEAREAAGIGLLTLLDPSQPDGRAVQPLVRALERPGIDAAERLRLVKALGLTGSPRAAKPLVALAERSDDPQLRGTAIYALGYVSQGSYDSVLVKALDDDDPELRLKAAIALRRGGGARTAAQLIERFDRAAEQDRGAVAIALGGPLSKLSDPALARRAVQLLEKSRGKWRDALIESVLSMPGELGLAPARRLASSAQVEDRAKAAELLAKHKASRSELLKLLADPEAVVRANALWSLASVGNKADVARALQLADDREVVVAANAPAVVAQLALRHGVEIREQLCGLLAKRHGHVVANALSALRVVGKRCADQAELELLAEHPSPVARRAAARLVRDVPPEQAEGDRQALERCVAEERDVAVASACKAPSNEVRDIARSGPLSVYVVPLGQRGPAPGAPFALVFENGLMRHGFADRRGAVYEPNALRGRLRLEVPAPLAR